ncbi:hypothetical protein Y1Q_0006329 [Alligator mississippiensis]|uniref:Secreted protein n=1 Tax=Alligator mississippiensis TaxID=8496 RepID=A0A151NXF0_ALLMI|nr:hypothetical protein Y1Q_0006329 [Alligator mississippiensis]
MPLGQLSCVLLRTSSAMAFPPQCRLGQDGMAQIIKFFRTRTGFHSVFILHLAQGEASQCYSNIKNSISNRD